MKWFLVSAQIPMDTDSVRLIVASEGKDKRMYKRVRECENQRTMCVCAGACVCVCERERERDSERERAKR